MNIHSAIKFGSKSSVKVAPPHEINADKAGDFQEKNIKLNDVAADNDKTNTQKMDNKKSTTMINEVNHAMREPKSAPVNPAFKAVDLNIAGTSHRINCPVNEVAQLEQAGNFINDKIREIRRDTKSKGLSNEELLVLVCLELYDGQESLKSERKNQIIDNERARALIEKINKDARSVL